MKPNLIELSAELFAKLGQEAEKLGVSVNTLVENLVRKFIQLQGVQQTEDAFRERRAHPRTKIEKSAVLFFRTTNGKYSVYKSGDVKDIAPGGVLLECGTTQDDEPLFAVGREFELIFQLNEDEPPLHIICQIRRIEQGNNLTRLGVAFNWNNEENSRIMQNLLN